MSDYLAVSEIEKIVWKINGIIHPENGEQMEKNDWKTLLLFAKDIAAKILHHKKNHFLFE